MMMGIIISVILLFAAIGLLALIHVCIVGRAFRTGGFNNGNMVQRGSIERSSMSYDDVQKLPCFDFKAGEKGSSTIDCAVCLENFKMGDNCRLLPICKHSFHAQCVDSWLLKTSICPICRTSAYSRCNNSTVSGEESSHSGEIGFELQDSQSAVTVGT